MLDQPTLARRAVDDAVARAEFLSHPLTTQYVRIYGVLVLILLDEEDASRRLLDTAIQGEVNASLGGWYVMNRTLEGFLLSREGHADRGIAMMQQAALEWAARGYKLAVPLDRTLLARACLAAGRPVDALHALEAGTAVARETGQHYADAELLRVRAELLAASGARTGEVHRLLQDAIDVATGQGAAVLV